MSRMILASEVGEAAAKWELARREACHLKAARASYQCEYYSPETEIPGDSYPANATPGVPHCWETDSPVEDWCEPCRLRQDIHQHVRPAVVKEHLARRRLRYIAGKFVTQEYGPRTA